MRAPIVVLALIAALPLPAGAATLSRYSCKIAKTLGPVSSTSGATVQIDRLKDAAVQTYFYDATTNKAETFDTHGDRVSLTAVKLPDGLRFTEASGAVTTIGANGDAQRVTTVTQGGGVSTSVEIGRCEVEKIEMRRPSFG